MGEKAEGYGIANYIFWQSATERPAGTPLCHVYKSCEVTRTPSLPGTNYEFVTEGACFDNDLDSYGLDIQSEIEGITSAAACQELCNSNAECNYFTYGNTVLSGKCWLKSAKAIALTSYPGLISGPKTCEWDLNAHSTECGTTTDEVFKDYLPSISDCAAAC